MDSVGTGRGQALPGSDGATRDARPLRDFPPLPDGLGDQRPPPWLRAVTEVNHAIVTGEDPDAVLRLVAHHTLYLVSGVAAAVLTPRRDGMLLVRATAGDAAAGLRHHVVPCAAGTLAAQAIQQRQPVIVAGPDPDRGPDFLLAATGADTALAVPVPGRGAATGVIEVVGGADRPFTPADLHLVELFAAQVALEVEHEHAREDLERLALTTTQGDKPLAHAMRELAASVVAGTSAVACAVHLLDADPSAADHRFTTAGASGMPAAAADLGRQAACHLGTPTPAEDAVLSRSPVVHSGVAGRLAREPTLRRFRGVIRELPWDTLVCLPLLARGAPLGVLCCHYPHRQRPADTELAYLSVIAGQAANAVDTSRLWAASQEKIALEERQRLARELHDSVSQALYGIALGARTAHEFLAQGDSEQARHPIGYILQLAHAGLTEMRALIFELRPEFLAEEGLVAALGKPVDALSSRHNLPIATHLGPEPAATIPVKQALYRIAQEALQNAARHAQARQVSVRLDSTARELVLEVSDDGHGFDPGDVYPGHLGLRSMRERAISVGGTCTVTSTPGVGTTVLTVVPASPSD